MNMEEGAMGQNKEGMKSARELAQQASQLWSDIESRTLESGSPIDIAFNMPESQDEGENEANTNIAYILNISRAKDVKNPVQVEYERLIGQGTPDDEIIQNTQEIITYLKRIKELQA